MDSNIKMDYKSIDEVKQEIIAINKSIKESLFFLENCSNVIPDSWVSAAADEYRNLYQDNISSSFDGIIGKLDGFVHSINNSVQSMQSTEDDSAKSADGI